MAANDRKNQLMSQADFARHRGVARSTVTEYKQKGLLVMTDDGLVDVEKTEEKLSSTLDPSRGGDRTRDKKPSADNRLSRAKVEELEIKTARQRLGLEKDAGRLVEKDVVYQAAFTMARNAQESIMSIADRLAPVLAAEGDAAKIHEAITDELRIVCNNLAKSTESLF